MTAVSTSFRTDPVYLNLIKQAKRKAEGAGESGGTEVAIINAMFADNEMRNRLGAMTFKSALKGRTERVAESKRQFDIRQAFDVKQAERGFGLSKERLGLRKSAQADISAYNMAGLKIREGYQDLQESGAEFSEGQGRIARTIGLLDVGLSIPTAISKARQDKEYIDLLRTTGTRLYGNN